MTALVAGYEYLGQNVDEGLKKELKEELLTLQKRMLTQHVKSMLSRGEDFDWEKVPDMLSVKGAEALAQLLVETSNISEEETSYGIDDPQELNVNEAKKVIAAITDPDKLKVFCGFEYLGKKRHSVLDKCEERNIYLIDPDPEEEESE